MSKDDKDDLSSCESDLIKTEALVLRLRNENERLKEALEAAQDYMQRSWAVKSGFNRTLNMIEAALALKENSNAE